MATAQEVIAQYQTLPEAEKNQVHAALPWPTGGGLNLAWAILLSGLVLLALGALWAAFGLANDDKSADAAWAVVTAIVGLLGGLFAPSPVANK